MKFALHLSAAARTVIGWAAFVIIVVALEATAFNYQHWQTADLQPQTIIQDGEYLDDNPREWSTPIMETADSTGPGILFKQPTSVRTISVEAEQAVTVRVCLSDEGFSQQIYALVKDVYPSIPATCTFPVNAYGGVSVLKVYATSLLDDGETEATEDDLRLTRVQINAPIPFQFSFLRVAVLLCAGLLIWGFSHKRRIFRMPVFRRPNAGMPNAAAGNTAASSTAPAALRPTRMARATLTAVSVVVSCILCAGMFVFPKALGHFGPPTEEEAAVETTIKQSEDGDPLEYHYYLPYEAQYAQLAEAFTKGRLDLDIEPFPGLKYLDNPYDLTLRSQLEEVYPVSIYTYWDMVYFQRHYYVYFGVLPVFLFYLPWFLATGQMFPTFIGVGIMLAVTVFGLQSLLLQLARRWFPNVSLGVMMLCVATVPLSSLMAWCAANPTIYALPVLCGLACLAWGASLYERLDRHPWLIVPGSVLLALIFACRPQIGAFCLLLIPFGVQALRALPNAGASAEGHRAHGVSRPAYAAAALAPFAVVLVLLGLYNAARFGSPFDFGANYNLTTNDMRLRPQQPEGALAGLYYLILQPPNIEPAFPLFCDTTMSFRYSAFMVYETCIGGVLWIAPVLWFLCGLLQRSREGQQLPGRLAWWRAAVAVAVGLALLITAFDALAAGVLPRYTTDFMMPLSVLAALGLMRTASVPKGGVQAWMAPAPIRPWVARCAKACLIVALVVNVAVSFYSWGRYEGERPAYLQEAITRIDTQLF